MAMEAYQKTVSGHCLMDLTLLHHHTQPPVLFRDMGLTVIVVVLLANTLTCFVLSCPQKQPFLWIEASISYFCP